MEKNTIEQIIKHCVLKYNNSQPESISEKIIEQLYFFRNNSIIQDDSFIINEQHILAGESQLVNVAQFINYYAENKNSCIYSKFSFIVANSSQHYSLSNIRTKSFNYSENFFIKLNSEKEIDLVVGISGLNNPYKTVTVTVFIIKETSSEKDDFFELLRVKLVQLGVRKIKIFRHHQFNSMEESFFNSLGFLFEAKLIKEDNGKDLYIYSKIMEA